ncbi:zinc finger HIT domain-containing protein 1 isoform X2 [Sander lucioperca]|uniref:zinc finger HIT domain-containing protein 1 isoform X2 n=1 Tax=Sander lucioperca TaxID=283035 RepID=UPI00165369C1|nr:zinc finger HIT domain-containing protein 1 isoform X2 [Sander lucioperca]
MVLEKKASARVEAGQRRVLDEATRQRRLTRQLEALEKDNFQRRRRGRREAITSSSASGRTSPRCWRRRLCPCCRKSPSHCRRRDDLRSFSPTSIMKPSSSLSSSSSSASSSSSSAASETRLLSSSSPPPLPRLSLRSPELQAQFLQECRNRFGSHGKHGEDGESGVFSSPSSSSRSSSSPSSPSPPSSTGSPASSSSPPPPSGDSRRDRLSLSSPELLSELKQSRSRSLRRVPVHNGMTTVFCGRGRGGQAPGSAPSTGSANHKTGGRETDRRSDQRT